MSDDDSDYIIDDTQDEPVDPKFKFKPNELLAYQRELKEEQALLERLLTKIDGQIHSLQVEQLHLLGLMNKSFKTGKTKNEQKTEEKTITEESNSKTLDLSVPNFSQYSNEEVEDDEEDEI